MKVLIVESRPELGRLWQAHLRRAGLDVRLVPDETGAAEALEEDNFDVIVLDLVLNAGSALAVADLAGYRNPDTRVIFVTNTSFFSDGSIFALNPNVRAFVPTGTPPEDLTAMIEHYGRAV